MPCFLIFSKANQFANQVAQIIPIGIGASNTAIQALNKAIPAWATSKNTTESPIWVVDQYTGFTTTELRDGVHPSEAGDQKMTKVWYPAIVNAIKIVQAEKGAALAAKREIEFAA